MNHPAGPYNDEKTRAVTQVLTVLTEAEEFTMQ